MPEPMTNQSISTEDTVITSLPIRQRSDRGVEKAKLKVVQTNKLESGARQDDAEDLWDNVPI